jgi:DNA replication protein DnaD
MPGELAKPRKARNNLARSLFTDAQNEGIDQAVTKTLEKLEAEVRKLSPQEQEQLRDWLENFLEDRLELTDDFKADIEAGKNEIAEGRVRIRKP